MTVFRSAPILLALTALWGSAQAQSLSQLYEAAKNFDAGYQSAKLQYQANLSRAEQAKAGVLPSANLQVGANRTHIGSDLAMVEKSYGSQSATVSGSQPLYRPANTATAEQGDKQIVLAQAQLTAAEQDLIVRVAQAYFDMLTASETLAFVKAQKAAVSEQLAAAKRNFEVGTTTITDTREAQAKYDLTLAQEIAAENDLRVKRLALEQLTGLPNAQPHPLRKPVDLAALAGGDADAWVAKALAGHPSIQQAQLGLDIARLETAKAQAGQKPTVDLTGSYTVSQNNGSQSLNLDYRTNVATLGVTLNWPLFTGYAVQNRIKETLALEDKARTDLEGAQRAITQATRTAFLGVQSGLGQVKALEAAEISSQSALDATQLGYQVGVRINADVLTAQTGLFDTKAKLAKARNDVVVGALRLRQASGTLTAEDVQQVNALLAH